MPALELREIASDSDKSASAVVPREVKGGSSFNRRIDQIRYAVVRILDPDPRRASAHAHEYHIETALAKEIDARLPVREALVALTKRRKGERCGRAVDADKGLATSEIGDRLIGALMETDGDRVAELNAAVEADPHDPSAGVTSMNAPEMLRWILDCLPPCLAVTATFGEGYLSPDVESRLDVLSPRLETISNDRDLRTIRCRLLIRDFPGVTNHVHAARPTALVRVAAAAMHLVNQLSERKYEA